MRSLPVLALVLLGCGARSPVGVETDAVAGRDVAVGFDDGGPEHDAGDDAGEDTHDDAGRDTDAGDDGGRGADAGDAAALECNPDAVEFLYLASGPLEEGNFCDDLEVCPSDDAQAERVMAVSSRLVCSETSSTSCEGLTCKYRGLRVIDRSELEDICAVTLLTPTPKITCIVWGP